MGNCVNRTSNIKHRNSESVINAVQEQSSTILLNKKNQSEGAEIKSDNVIPI
jgi:hypothetical protein